MNCQQVADDELVERYLNGQLAAALQDDLELHILECPHCLARAEAFEAARAGLAQRAHEIRLLPAKRALHRRLAWLGAAAAAVVVCALAWYQFRPGSHRSQPQTATQTQSLQNLSVATATPPGVTPAGAHQANAGAHVPTNTQVAGQKHPLVAGTAGKPQGKTSEMAAGAKPEQAASTQTANSAIVAEQHGDQKTGSSASEFAVRHKSSPTQLSEDQAVELYSLATVQPPAYSFAGVAASSSPPAAGTSSSGTQGFTIRVGAGHTLFQSAMTAYVEKRYADAAESLQTVIAGEPKASDANFYLGISKLMQGQPRDAIAPFKAVLAAPPGTLTQSAHFYLAKAYLQMSNLGPAEEEMQAAAEMPGRLTAEARSLAARIQALRKSMGQQAGSGAQKPN